MGSKMQGRMRDGRLSRRDGKARAEAHRPSNVPAAGVGGPALHARSVERPVAAGTGQDRERPETIVKVKQDPRDDVVIFLDGLGTLNGHEFRSKAGEESADPAACRIVNEIVAETGARIVVSSSWRFNSGCRSRLIAAGLDDAFHAEWATGVMHEGLHRRGLEIAEWLARHPEVVHYVILDDETNLLREQYPRHVRIDYATGLTPMRAAVAVDKIEHSIADLERLKRETADAAS